MIYTLYYMSAILEEPRTEFRPMTAEDVAAVVNIEKLVYPFPWTEGIFRDCIRVGYGCWVAIKGDTVVGYAIMSVAVGECHILNLAIRPEFQSQGLGRFFMEHLLSVAKESNVDMVFLEVRPSNLAALGLYHSLGFNQFGTRKGYYPATNGREDAVVMALNF